MKVSLNWLSEFVAISANPQELAEKLTLSTCEVEGVLDQAQQFEGVFVGKVLTKEQHPNADRLSVATVDIGNGPVDVVCGAANLEVGQLVAFATVGTTLPNGLTLKKTDIRGTVSEGMICAEDELGLGDDHSGIMVLDPQKAQVGMPLSQYFGLDDTVFEIDNKSITHRPDLFSHMGIAGEIAALYESELKMPELPDVQFSDERQLSIDIQDPKRCRRYVGVRLSGIEMKPTPEFIVKRLQAVGLRSINVVVDIANYVMLEWGQPLHTFDASKLSGDTVYVRNAQKGERLISLEDVELELSEDDLVIADQEKPVALAGVMGAKNSEVEAGTTEILLEVATFDGPTIRRASWRHGIRSEAVLRFEKGQPVELPGRAVKRAVQLLEQYAGAHVSSRVVDMYPEVYKPEVITVDPGYVTRVLGFNISIQEMKERLEALYFSVEEKNNALEVTVPWFREGMQIEEELIEEIGRLRGTDSIAPEPFSDLIRPVAKDIYIEVSRKVKTILAGLGLDEIYTYSFYGEKLLKKSELTAEDHFEVSDPLSQDLKYMRKGLLPYHLEKMELNVQNFEKPAFFEVGHVYHIDNEKQEDVYSIQGVREFSEVSGLLFGDKKDIFYEAKGVAEQLLEGLGIDFDAEEASRTDEAFNAALYDDFIVLHFTAQGEKLGSVALVDPKVQKQHGIKRGYIAAFSFNIPKLAAYQKKVKEFSQISDFPKATVDLAFVMKNTIPLASVEGVIRKESGELLRELNVFDIYRGKPLSDDEKSIAFHLVFQSLDRTLEDAEIKKIREKIEKHLDIEFGAKIRDF